MTVRCAVILGLVRCDASSVCISLSSQGGGWGRILYAFVVQVVGTSAWTIVYYAITDWSAFRERFLDLVTSPYSSSMMCRYVAGFESSATGTQRLLRYM